MPSIPRVVIRRRSARPFFARHPWVFVTSIERVEGNPAPGDEVEVVSHEGQFIGRGLFNPRGAIRVRLYRWDGGPLDDVFFVDRIREAVSWRARLLDSRRPHSGIRLIFSEADGLSGLIVDQFDRWLIAQFSGVGLFERRAIILEALQSIDGIEGIVLRGERATAEAEGLHLDDSVAWGSLPDQGATIIENEVRYLVDLTSGQKTGFYLDQRDNRRSVASLARGRSVLDLYCYTGGFSLNALKNGGANETLGVDSSAAAIDRARAHAELNGLADSARFEVGDVPETIDRFQRSGRRFGMVICDPPKFAKHPKGVERALKAYLSLNRAALGLVEADGILVTCSCSGLIERGLFADLIGQVAELSGRTIQILDQRGQALDHPVSASCLETDYLKCFVCRVG